MMPPARVAIASPVKIPAPNVGSHARTVHRAMAAIATVAHDMAAINGTSIGVKNKLPYRYPVVRHRMSAAVPAHAPYVNTPNGSSAARPHRPATKVKACRIVSGSAAAHD